MCYVCEGVLIMKLTPAVPWQQQMLEKQQRKLSWQQEEKVTPLAWAQKATEKKASSMVQPGLTLSDVLNGMLPGGVAGLNGSSGTQLASPSQPTEAEQRMLGEIDLKMKTGQALNDDEMKLLEKHNPIAHQKAKQIKAEREQYRKELENCKSKEEVEELKQRQLAKFSAEMQAVQRSSMSKGDKVKAMEFIAMRMAGTENEYQDYVAGARYKGLPDKLEKEKPASKDVEMPVPEPETPEAPQEAQAAEDLGVREAEAPQQNTDAASAPVEQPAPVAKAEGALAAKEPSTPFSRSV